jgi:hypothetical protein
MLIIELARAKDLKKIKRLGTVNFVLLGLFVLCALLLPLVPYPSPSMAYYGPILPASGGVGVILILIQSFTVFIVLLSFATAIGLLFDRGWSRTIAPVTLAVFALFPFYPIPVGLSHAVPYNGPTGIGSSVLQTSFFMMIITTFIMVLRLRDPKFQWTQRGLSKSQCGIMRASFAKDLLEKPARAKIEMEIKEEIEETAPYRYLIANYGADFTVDGLVKRLEEAIYTFQSSKEDTYGHIARASRAWNH